ncbi:MAG TPA: DUF6230 family protein [Nocardioidaceae bacterium]|nr:DUF6230 family protein [Nocardioidaceae bacterium]
MAASGVVYGTRWGRTNALVLIALLVIAGIVVAVKQQVIAANLVFQSSTSQLATSAIDGSDVGFGVVRMTRSTGSGGGTDVKNVLRGGFANGKLDGLCVSQVQSILGVNMTLKITAGDGVLGTYEIQGSNALFDIVSIRGTNGSNGSGINMDGRAQFGLAASDVTTTKTNGVFDINPLEADQGTGWFGIDADKGNLYNIRGTIYDGVIGGPFSLPNLSITVTPGTSGCDASPLPK